MTVHRILSNAEIISISCGSRGSSSSRRVFSVFLLPNGDTRRRAETPAHHDSSQDRLSMPLSPGRPPLVSFCVNAALEEAPCSTRRRSRAATLEFARSFTSLLSLSDTLFIIPPTSLFHVSSLLLSVVLAAHSHDNEPASGTTTTTLPHLQSSLADVSPSSGIQISYLTLISQIKNRSHVIGVIRPSSVETRRRE